MKKYRVSGYVTSKVYVDKIVEADNEFSAERKVTNYIDGHEIESDLEIEIIEE